MQRATTGPGPRSVPCFCSAILVGTGRALLSPVSQVSLQAYKKLFNQTIERTERNNDVAKRIESLIAAITLQSYIGICRGLFESHKLLYAFLMAVEILRHKQVSRGAVPGDATARHVALHALDQCTPTPAPTAGREGRWHDGPGLRSLQPPAGAGPRRFGGQGPGGR